MALSSSSVGIFRPIFLDGFDIVIDLTAIGSAETNNSSYRLAIYKGNKEERVSNWSQGNHPDFTIISPIINPNQSCIPTEFSRARQRNAVLAQIGRVLARVEIELHTLM